MKTRHRLDLLIWLALLCIAVLEVGGSFLPIPAGTRPILALPAVVAASDLVATVPQRTARQIAAMADIQIMPLAIDLSATVSMAWHRRAASEPAQIWFRSLLTDEYSKQIEKSGGFGLSSAVTSQLLKTQEMKAL